MIQTNDCTITQYQIQLFDQNVPYNNSSDLPNNINAILPPLYSKWIRQAIQTNDKSVTITNVLRTSYYSDEPTEDDYTVFFSNDKFHEEEIQNNKKRKTANNPKG